VLNVKSVHAPHARASDYDSDSFDDPAAWSRCATAETAVDVLEPFAETPNEYREASLDLLQLLLATDRFMSSSRNGVLAWVSVSRVLGLPGTRGLPQVEICRQMGVSESTLSRSMSRFRAIAGFDDGGDHRIFGLPRLNGHKPAVQ
jgi:hypothetical protein